jgi:predicted O-methyltransferase YrrM
MGWNIPAEASISEEEAAVFASLAAASGATFVVETGTDRGVGTRRIRSALNADIEMASVDLEPDTEEISGVTLIAADTQSWQPTKPIGALFLDCGRRDHAWDNLKQYVISGAPVVVHDASFAWIESLGGIRLGRLQIAVAP